PGDRGNSGSDDETVGTLPIVGGNQQFDIVRRIRDSRPSFFLQGPADEAWSTIIGLSGAGKLSVETLPNGEVRLGFHGRLQLDLDQGVLNATNLQVGIYVPS